MKELSIFPSDLSPEAVLHRARKRIKPESVTAFVSAFVMGLIAHAYVFFNDLPNHDGIQNVWATQDMTTSGRWFLQAACGITGYFNLPWTIGLVSLVWIGLACAFIVELFGVKNKLNIFLVSAFIVTFPSVTGTFLYMFTADGYMLSFLLAVLSVYCTAKMKRGFLLGAPLLCLSIGAYQANISVAIVLYTFIVAFDALDTSDTKGLIKRIIKYLTTGSVGAVLYFIVLKVILAVRGLELTEYRGMNEMKLNILSGMSGSFASFLSILSSSEVAGSPVFFVVFVVLFALCFAILSTKLLASKTYKNVFKLLLLPVLFCSLPFTLCCMYFVSDDIGYYFPMCSAFSLLFAVIPVIMEKYCNIQSYSTPFVRWICFILSALFVVHFCLISNTAYKYIELKNERTYSMVSDMLEDLEKIEDWQKKPLICAEKENKIPDTLNDMFNDNVCLLCNLGFKYERYMSLCGFEQIYETGEFYTYDFKVYLNLYFNTDCTLMGISDFEKLKLTQEYKESLESRDDTEMYNIIEVGGGIIIVINQYSE